jgi:DNA-binding ferritin-like protein (Dps family)
MEYAGYVQRNQPTDWSKVTGQIAQQIGAVEEKREAKREKLDTMFSETTAMMGDVEMGESPEFNEIILDTTDRGRARIYDAYKQMRAGEITPSQFTRIQSNMQARWGEFDTAVKQKNNRLAEIEKRTREGTNSQREFWQNEQIAEMNNFSNHRMDWDDKGNLSYVQIDPNTGDVIEGSSVAVSAVNKTQNVLVDKFDVSTKVSKYSKTLGKFKDEIDGMTVGGTLAMPEYENTRDRIIGDVLGSNMNNYADALVDSSTDEYFLYKEGDIIPPGKEDLAIKMVMKDRQWIAEPTDKQKEAARELVGQTIDDQVGYTRATATGATKGTFTAKDKAEFKTAYTLATDWAAGKNLGKLIGLKTPNKEPIIDAKSTGDGIAITYIKGKGDDEETITDVIPNDPEVLVKYGGYEKAVKGSVAYEEGKKAYEAETGQSYAPEAVEIEDIEEIKPLATLADSDSDKDKKLWEKKKKLYKTWQDLDYDTESGRVNEGIRKEIITTLYNAGLTVSSEDVIVVEPSDKNEKVIIKLQGDTPDQVEQIEVDYAFFNPGANPNQMDEAITKIANRYRERYNKLDSKYREAYRWAIQNPGSQADAIIEKIKKDNKIIL